MLWKTGHWSWLKSFAIGSFLERLVVKIENDYLCQKTLNTLVKSAQNRSISCEIWLENSAVFYRLFFGKVSTKISAKFPRNRPFFSVNLSLKIPRNLTFFPRPNRSPAKSRCLTNKNDNIFNFETGSAWTPMSDSVRIVNNGSSCSSPRISD